jgi:hypothetical protein
VCATVVVVVAAIADVAVTGVAAHVEVVAELDVASPTDVSSSLLGCAAEWAIPAPIATNAAALAAAVMRRARLAG